MDYNTLIDTKAKSGSIKSWVNSDSVPSPDIIADTEEWLSRNMRVRRMQRRIHLTLLKGASEISLTDPPVGERPDSDPTGPSLFNFLDPIRLHLIGFDDLELIPEDDIDKRRATGTDGELSESSPNYWTIIGDSILFDTMADETYGFWFTYYQRPQPLSPTKPTNLYTTEWRNPFKFAAMGFSYIFLKDEQRAATLFTLAQSEIQKGVVLDDRVRRGMTFDVQVS